MCSVGSAYGAGCSRGIIGQWVADRKYAKKEAISEAKKSCKELKFKYADILHSAVISDGSIKSSSCKKVGCVAHTGCTYSCKANAEVKCKIEVRK